jgi:tetratricopeptide (TPR) repeat protein
MTAKKISLCMIIKDEEDYLGGALDSVASIVDEIIVVDTGSSDASPDIAREFGAKVLTQPWTNDFSKARNRALAEATGDYILILDADEKISNSDHGKILMAVQSDSPAAFQFQQRTYMYNSATVGWLKCVEPYPEAENYPGYIQALQVRLLPNHSGLRYQGQVHELLEPACERIGLPVKRLPVPVHHYGKVRSASYLLKKAKMYLDLGREKLSRWDPAGPDNGGLITRPEPNLRGVYELGVQLLELRMLEESRELFEQVLAAVPDDLESRNMLGVVHTKLGDLDRALPILEEVVAADPQFADAWNNLGVVQLERRDVQAARFSLEKAVTIDPDNANALANYAIAMAETGQSADALTSLAQAIRINPWSGRFKLLRAVILNQVGDAERARECLGNLPGAEINLSPADVLHLSSLAVELDAFSELELFIKSRLDVVPNDRTVVMKLVSLFESLKRKDLARLLLTQAVELHGRFTAARNSLGCILAGEASYREALEQFTVCVEEEPDNPLYIKNMALACERSGLLKQAIESYVYLAGKDPGSADYARRRLLTIQDKVKKEIESDKLLKAGGGIGDTQDSVLHWRRSDG